MKIVGQKKGLCGEIADSKAEPLVRAGQATGPRVDTAQAQFPLGTISGIPEPPTFQASCLICIPYPLPPAVLENVFTSSRKPFLKQNQAFFQCLWPASTPAYIWRILIYYIYPRVPYFLLPEFKLWVLPGPLKPQYSDCSQCICV